MGELTTCLFLIKKYWTAFFVGAGIFVIIHFIVLSSQAPEGSAMNINSSSVSGTIGEAIVIFIIPFFVAALIYGFTKKPVKKETETKSLKEDIQSGS